MDYRGLQIFPDENGDGLPESRGWPAMTGAEDSIAAAHARGMKVYLDIITNHSADVIKYRECPANDCAYRGLADYPHSRRGGLGGRSVARDLLLLAVPTANAARAKRFRELANIADNSRDAHPACRDEDDHDRRRAWIPE